MRGVVIARQCENAPMMMHCPIVQALAVRGAFLRLPFEWGIQHGREMLSLSGFHVA